MDTLAQLGIGGVVAILVIREVLKFLARPKNGNGGQSAGQKSVEFWQNEHRTTIKDSMNDILRPFLSNQIELLREIRDLSAKTREGVAELVVLQRLTVAPAILSTIRKSE